MRKLPKFGRCFICGDKNESGAAVTWMQTAEGVEGSYRCPERHCGFEGILHGGVLAGLLDECVGWAVALRNKTMCFTGELKVRYQKPVPVDREIRITGRCVENTAEGKKYLLGAGEILDGDGTVYASCEAKFFPMPQQLAAAVMEKLEVPDAPPGTAVSDYLWGGTAGT